MGAARVWRRRRRGHPRGSPMSRCPSAGDLGAGPGWAAWGARGGAGRGRVLRPACPPGDPWLRAEKAGPDPPEAGAWAGGEGRAAPASPPGARGLGRGRRAGTQRRGGPRSTRRPGSRRGSLPAPPSPGLSAPSPSLRNRAAQNPGPPCWSLEGVAQPPWAGVTSSRNPGQSSTYRPGVLRRSDEPVCGKYF